MKKISIILCLALLACAPRVHHYGYVFDDRQVSRLEAGRTSKEQVREILGTPSGIAIVDAGVYYYIASHTESHTYNLPEEVERVVLAVYFDDADVVQEVKYYGLAEGNTFSFVERETVTLGKELTILEQLFGNLGRIGSANAGATP